MSMTKINDKKQLQKTITMSMAKINIKNQYQKSISKIKKIKLLLKLYVNLRFLFPSTD